MTKPAPVVIVAARNEAEFIETMRRRRHELGFAQLDLDERIGFQLGYVGKLERPDGITRNGKRWGRRCNIPTLCDWAQGLGCALALVPLDLIEPDGEDGARPKPRQLVLAFADDLPPIEQTRRGAVHDVYPVNKRHRSSAPTPKAKAA